MRRVVSLAAAILFATMASLSLAGTDDRNEGDGLRIVAPHEAVDHATVATRTLRTGLDRHALFTATAIAAVGAGLKAALRRRRVPRVTSYTLDPRGRAGARRAPPNAVVV